MLRSKVGHRRTAFPPNRLCCPVALVPDVLSHTSTDCMWQYHCCCLGFVGDSPASLHFLDPCSEQANFWEPVSYWSCCGFYFEPVRPCYSLRSVTTPASHPWLCRRACKSKTASRAHWMSDTAQCTSWSTIPPETSRTSFPLCRSSATTAKFLPAFSKSRSRCFTVPCFSCSTEMISSFWNGRRWVLLWLRFHLMRSGTWAWNFD